MKRFLKYFAVFVSPVLLAAICFEILLQNIPNDYKIKKATLDANAKNIEVLFLGNSHLYYGIDPKYIHRKSYNAAYVSQSLDYDLAILRKYEKNWKNLKYIVLPVDYFSLYFTLGHSVESWRRKNYGLYYGIRQGVSISQNSELFSNKFILNLRRAYGYYLKGRDNITTTSKGWGSDYLSSKSKDLEVSGKRAAKRHVEGKDQGVFDENVSILHAIADFARKRNVKVIFITSPAYKTYVENLEPHGFDTTVAEIGNIVRKNPNVQYFNLMNDPTFDKEDFYDGDHLNEIGARKLSMKIDSLVCYKK